LTTERRMHISEDRAIPARQFMPRHQAIGHGFGADKYLPHTD